MKTIELNDCYETEVSDEDYEYLRSWYWSGIKQKSGIYVQRCEWDSAANKWKTISMSRTVLKRMGISVEGLRADHIDGNPLNNQRSNLQAITHSQNIQKGKIRVNNTSGVTGVTFDKARNKWLAYVDCDMRRVFQKRYNTFEEAAEARRIVAAKYFPTHKV